MKQLWTFLVTQGDSFELTVHGNPRMVHDGQRSVLKALCTTEQAEKLEDEMRAHGCKVEANLPHESEEQTAIRKNLFAIIGEDSSFPCVKCPECAWFDPYLEGLCGAGFAPQFRRRSWEPEVVQERLANEKFKTDWDACPLNQKELN